MTKQKPKTKLPQHYLIELIILVLGISISFLMNEWRLNNRDDHERDRLVLQLKEDLKGDTTMVNASLKFLAQLDSVSKVFGQPDSLRSLDDVRKGLPYMLNTMSHSFHHTTYTELESAGKLNLLNDSLRGKVIAYYSEKIPSTYEWHSIDKNQALPRLMDYVNKEFPYAWLFDYRSLSEEDSVLLYSKLSEDEFLNIVQFNLIIKSGVTAQYHELREAASAILVEIEKEIQE